MTTLTPLYVYAEEKREELRQLGQVHVPNSELATMFKALPGAQRRVFEAKAVEQQKRYFKECREKALAAIEAGAAMADDDDGEEEEDDNGDEEGEGEAEGEANDEVRVQLPLARVTRIIKLHPDTGKYGREACFMVVKATEAFLERTVWEAAATATRSQRKTIMLRDITGSMRRNPNPESMQAFVEEFQPIPPKPEKPVKGKGRKGGGKKKAAGSGAVGKRSAAEWVAVPSEAKTSPGSKKEKASPAGKDSPVKVKKQKTRSGHA